MKKGYRLICSLLILLAVASIFSCCVGQKTVPTGSTSQQSTTTQTSDSTSQNQDTTSQTGTPYLLASISYDIETVDRNNHIYLSIENFGKGTAKNVAVIISNDYYSNFTLQSVDPAITVEGNKFFIGNIDAGEKFILNIYLKANQSGVYTGTISYTYDGLETSGKIKDLTTRVP
ncbi:MAG: hypothetical protein HPY60_01090 [Candidatus Methanofastidiosum sp.]|nr:hypothetical protein [Methanofastidiosum sp.]